MSSSACPPADIPRSITRVMDSILEVSQSNATHIKKLSATQVGSASSLSALSTQVQLLSTAQGGLTKTLLTLASSVQALASIQQQQLSANLVAPPQVEMNFSVPPPEIPTPPADAAGAPCANAAGALHVTPPSRVDQAFRAPRRALAPSFTPKTRCVRCLEHDDEGNSFYIIYLLFL